MEIKKCDGICHFAKSKACKRSSIKVDQVLVQYKETESQVGLKFVGLVFVVIFCIILFHFLDKTWLVCDNYIFRHGDEVIKPGFSQ